MTTRAMSPLRQRMLEDMQLRGLSARTQEAYTRAVAQLARHYQRSPEQLGDEDLREYFLHLTKEKKLARPTVTIALCGLKFFYEQTLKQSWPTLGLVRPQPEHKLPVVLSRAEVRSIRPAAILIARSLTSTCSWSRNRRGVLSFLSPGPTTPTRSLTAPPTTPTKGSAMILTCSLLTQTDTPPLALAYFTPTLVTTLSAFPIGEDLKLVIYLKTRAVYLKTLVRPRPRFSPLTQIGGAHSALLLA